MSLAYLLARTADSVADGEWLPPEGRLKALDALTESLLAGQPTPEWVTEVAAVVPSAGSEAALICHFPTALEEYKTLPATDRELTRDIVLTLAEGMRVDLRRFPGAVQTAAELERHLWAAAGCVGAFWTAVTRLHEPAVARAGELGELGTRLGNALQLTNVLRDIPRDLREGRCYLPLEQLASAELSPENLLDPASERQLAPLFFHWMEHALDDFEASMDYVLRLPARCWRLRLAALWPWRMGLGTLQALCPPGWLGRVKRKVSRPWVFRMLATTALQALYTPWLRASMRNHLRAARQACQLHAPKAPRS